MNTAVAVGLITAGSTLAGGIIASLATIKAQNNQIKQQMVIAQAERAERQNSERRAIRREAYVQLLNKFDEADNLMTECWKARPDSRPVESATEAEVAVEEGVKSFDSAVNTVRLEGPPSVVDAAVKASQAFWDEMRYQAYLTDIDVTGSFDILQPIDPDKYDELHKIRLTARADLIKAAASALNETR